MLQNTIKRHLFRFDTYEPFKHPHVHEAVSMLNDAINKIKPDTIRNGWTHSNILSPAYNAMNFNCFIALFAYPVSIYHQLFSSLLVVILIDIQKLYIHIRLLVQLYDLH